jgi:hypothetical protein
MLEALAAVILFGLMFVPLINIAVGLIAGGFLWGPFGAISGGLIGLVISGMVASKMQ